MADVELLPTKPAPASYSREQLERFIDEGRSVNAGARGIVSHKDHLPPAHELAGGDPAKQAEAVEDLEKQRADLDARIKAAQDAKAKADADAQAEADRKAAEAQAAQPEDAGKGK